MKTIYCASVEMSHSSMPDVVMARRKFYFGDREQMDDFVERSKDWGWVTNSGHFIIKIVGRSIDHLVTADEVVDELYVEAERISDQLDWLR